MAIVVNHQARENGIQVEYNRVLANIKQSASEGKDTFRETVESFDSSSVHEICRRLEKEEGVKIGYRGMSFTGYTHKGVLYNIKFFVD